MTTSSANVSTSAPVVTPEMMERQMAYEALMLVLSYQAISNHDAAWLGFLDNMPNPMTMDKGTLELYCQRVQAYIDFQSSIFPFPKGSTLVFVDDSPEPEMVQALLEAQANGYCKVYSADWNADDKVLEGVAMPVFATQIMFVNGKAESNLIKEVLEPYNATLHGSVDEVLLIGEDTGKAYDCPWVKPVGYFQVRHLVNILSNRSKHEVANFVAMTTGMKQVEPGVIKLAPDAGNKLAWSELVFDFNNNVIKTSRDFPQRLESFLTHIGPVSVEVSMALQAIEMAGMDADTSQRQIDAMLANRTQVFEEEDNYGAEMFSDEQLRTIREHSIALMMVKAQSNYPYFTLQDNNNPVGVGQCIDWLVAEGRPFFPDKNGAKRVVCDEGVTALMLGMVEDTAVFVTDVQKPKKTLNRNWQAVAIRAMEGVPGSEGYKPYAKAALRVMDRRNYLPEGHPNKGVAFTVGVTGDSTNVILHNGRLANAGSGVGITRRKFSFMVPKKLRGQVSSIHIPAGKTLADVESALHQQLTAMFSEEGKVLKSSDPGSTKTLLSYNGLPIIKYSATNQDLLLDKKYCSFSIKNLASSNSLAVEVTVPYIASDYEVKGRGAGIKAVLQQASGHYAIQNSDGMLNNEWEASINMECQKGQLARLYLYAEALYDQFGEYSYLEFGKFDGNDLATAVLHYPVGNGEFLVQDLGNADAPFYQWQQEQFQVFYITDVVNMGYATTTILGQAGMLHRRGEGLSVIAEALNSPEWNDVVMVNANGQVTNDINEAIVVNSWGQKGIRLMEKVQGIQGSYPIMIECATRRESSASYQASTLEAMTMSWATLPAVGEAMANAAEDNLDAVSGMVAMAANDPDLLLDEDDIAAWV